MQIPPRNLGPKQVPAVDGLSEAKENADLVRALKVRVFLIIENRLLRDTLAHMLRRRGDVEVSGKCGSGETNPEEVGKSGCDVALLDFVEPHWISAVREHGQEAGRAIRIVAIGMDANRSLG